MTQRKPAPKAKPAAKKTAAAPRRKRRKASAARPSAQRAVRPTLVYLVFVAIGLGTWGLAQDTRVLALWSVLLLGSLILGAGRGSLRVGYSLPELARGVIFGLVLGLPIALLAPAALAVTAERLFSGARPEALLLRLVLVAPVVEGVYFRGFLQPAVGLGIAALLYGLAGLVLFFPPALGFPAVLVTIAAVLTVFGLIYGVIAERYSVAASIACQAAVALCLWILPKLSMVSSQLSMNN